MKTCDWPLPPRVTHSDGSTHRSFGSHPLRGPSRRLLTTEQQSAAAYAARQAYIHGLYGDATHNHQHAEIACAAYLLKACHLPQDYANALGRELAGEVVREIETARPEQPF